MQAAVGIGSVARLLAGALLASLAVPACRAEEGLREQELAYLRAAVAPDLLPFSHVEIPGLEHIRIAERQGRTCLGLRTVHGQAKKNGGVRAEVSLDIPFRSGDALRYEWSFLIPADLRSDAPQNRWWVLADWHDQPDRTRGETWDGFPSRSAPIIFAYGQVDGRDVVSFSYGAPDAAVQALIPVKRERWHTIAMRTLWSRGAAGRAAVSLDGKPVAAASGPNMLNDFQHYMKVGSYRHPDIEGDAWIYIAGLRVRRD